MTVLPGQNVVDPGINHIDPFLRSFIPEKIVPPHNTTSDLWVIGNNTLFDTQWIECSYPISGSYGPTPRYIYYALIVFTLLARKNAWLVKAALGSVMIYSSTAAIHAIVLVSIRTKLVPKYLIENYMVILVEGTTQKSKYSGGFTYNTPGATWLPVLPMAWDNDSDPVLAIIGIAFLVLLPMQLWSSTFKKSEGKAVLFIWSGLLLIGVICALVNEAYSILWTFPQLRFCPPNFNDTLPLTNSGSDVIGMDWDHVDWYYWNRTVYNYFTDPSSQSGNTCLYPCFATAWPLRDPSEITVVSGTFGGTGDSDTGYKLLFALYFVVCSSGVSSLTLVALDITRRQTRKLAYGTYSPSVEAATPSTSYLLKLGRKVKAIHSVFPNDGRSRILRSRLPHLGPRILKYLMVLGRAYLWIINLYARIISPLAVLFFVGWIEWYIWTSDPRGETFRHVGQWGALLAAAFVILAAIAGRIWPTPDKPPAEPRRLIRLQRAHSI